MEEERVVAWFCTYTPLEILDAAGLVPIRHLGDPSILESADTLLHSAICPYTRACLAQELRRKGPHHAIFVNSCDAMRRLSDAWKNSFPDAFVFLMDLPRNEGTWGEEMLIEEFRSLIKALEETWGVEVTPKALRDASLSREERRLNYLTKADGKCGGERLRLAMEAHSALQDEIETPYRGKNNGVGIPVLLTGNLLNPAGIVQCLDQAGAKVAWIDLCNGDRSFTLPTLAEGEDLDQLLTTMARAYLDRHPCARMSDSGRRYRLLLEKAREVGARGIIYASLKFCDSYLYDFPRVQEILKREGIPLLRLESDYTDGHTGQLLTRVEAFLEMI